MNGFGSGRVLFQLIPALALIPLLACGTTGATAGTVRDFLGAGVLGIVSEPDRAEIYDVTVLDVRGDGFSDRFVRQSSQPKVLKFSQLQKVRGFILDEKSYVFDGVKNCLFRPTRALDVIRGEKRVTVFLDFSCSMWLFADGETGRLEDFDPVAGPLKAALGARTFD